MRTDTFMYGKLCHININPIRSMHSPITALKVIFYDLCINEQQVHPKHSLKYRNSSF